MFQALENLEDIFLRNWELPFCQEWMNSNINIIIGLQKFRNNELQMDSILGKIIVTFLLITKFQ